MPGIRSQWFAVFAVLFLMTVGAMASERCHCDESATAASCEHAGQSCAREDDCSDCHLSCAHEGAVAEATAPVFLSKTPLSPAISNLVLAYVALPLLIGGSVRFDWSAVPTGMPLALRPGNLALRV